MTPQIGDYCAECCLLDLFRIETSADLSYAIGRVSSDDEPLMVFRTLEDAVRALRGPVVSEDEAAALRRLGWVEP